MIFRSSTYFRFSRLSSQTEPQLSGVKLLKKAWKLLKNRYQLLLLPLTVWLGLEKAVIAADYTSVSINSFKSSLYTLEKEPK